MYYYKYVIGGYEFLIAEDKGFITDITLDKEIDGYKLKETELIIKTKRELEEYFLGKRKSFDIPIKLKGTLFQKKVWNKMRKIPYGKTVSYGDLAALSGSPKAMRAVGNVCHKNRILIIVPCHRVVASHGIGGFGKDIGIKINLLELENAEGVFGR